MDIKAEKRSTLPTCFVDNEIIEGVVLNGRRMAKRDNSSVCMYVCCACTHVCVCVCVCVCVGGGGNLGENPGLVVKVHTV